MLSKDLRDLFDELDAGDPLAKRRRAVYSALFDVAKQIRLMRKASGMSVRRFAKELNTSHATVLRWETPGYAGYTLSKLIEISHVLGYRLVFSFMPLTGDISGKNDWGSLNLNQINATEVRAGSKKKQRSLLIWDNVGPKKGATHVV